MIRELPFILREQHRVSVAVGEKVNGDYGVAFHTTLDSPHFRSRAEPPAVGFLNVVPGGNTGRLLDPSGHSRAFTLDP